MKNNVPELTTIVMALSSLGYRGGEQVIAAMTMAQSAGTNDVVEWLSEAAERGEHEFTAEQEAHVRVVMGLIEAAIDKRGVREQVEKELAYLKEKADG